MLLRADLPEIPAGMLDGSGHFKGVAAEEIQVPRQPGGIFALPLKGAILAAVLTDLGWAGVAGRVPYRYQRR